MDIFRYFSQISKIKLNRKRLVIDARVVLENQGHGIAKHTYELICHLIQQPLNFDIVLLVNKGSPFFRMDLPPHVSLFRMRTGWIQFSSQLELPFVLWILKPDLFHSPSFMVPIICNAKLLMTIHDLNHVRLSQNYSFVHKLYYKVFLRFHLRRSVKIITVSEFSKKEIMHFFNLEEGHIEVIYNGLSEVFLQKNTVNPMELNDFRNRYELPERFILSIGNPKPHKNLKRMVEAYCSKNFELPLVLLSDFDAEIIESAILNHKKHCIFFCRFVPDDELWKLYKLADVLVYPSIYEGFGLPPLEAAACGKPVVVSHCSSLPEVMRDAAVYVDPLNPTDIARGIDLVLSKTPDVQDKISKGITLAKDYSWEKMTQKTLHTYTVLLEQTRCRKPTCSPQGG